MRCVTRHPLSRASVMAWCCLRGIDDHEGPQPDFEDFHEALDNFAWPIEDSDGLSWRHGERVVPIFIDRGAPLRNTPSPPNAADYPMQAIKLTQAVRATQSRRIKMTERESSAPSLNTPPSGSRFSSTTDNMMRFAPSHAVSRFKARAK